MTEYKQSKRKRTFDNNKTCIKRSAHLQGWYCSYKKKNITGIDCAKCTKSEFKEVKDK